MKQASGEKPGCQHAHLPVERRAADPAALDRAARLFRAMGDGARMRLLHLLLPGECCVSELVSLLGDKFPTVSQRLRVLRTEGLVTRRRAGLHVFYALADRHVADLVANAVAHADHLPGTPTPSEGASVMAHSHSDHGHQHGPNCGHTAVRHAGHTDYLHDGHLHHVTGGGMVEDHAVEVSATNPTACTPDHNCGAHPDGHQHGPNCGHEAVPHGDHVDYLVDGHLHHPHAGHCDDHGPLAVVG